MSWLLPAALGTLILVLGIAALERGNDFRHAVIEREAGRYIVELSLGLQRRLFERAAALDGDDAIGISGEDVTLWRYRNGRLTAEPERMLGDSLFVAQVFEFAERPLAGPLVTSTGRDYVLQGALRDDGWLAITAPADMLLPAIESGAVAADSLTLGWASSDPDAGVILRASLRTGGRQHVLSFPVPGGAWQIQYDSMAGQVQADLRWALYVAVAALAYLAGLVLHRLQHKPWSLRGDLERLEQRFRKLNAELAVQLRDREQAQDRMYQLSITDTETGLPNRQALTARIEALLDEQRTQEEPKPVTLILLGLRDVENAEHTLGHSVVSSLLPELADRLRVNLRDSDYVARSGNYQLAVLIPGADTQSAIARVRRWCGQPTSGVYEHEFGNVNVAPRFGIATATDGYGFAERLLDNAMSALSDADAATTRYSVFAADSRDDRATRIQLESDFKSAIEDNEFRLYFQPIVHTETGRPRGFECLVRWQHPVEGLLPPGRFIELGEKTGLITELTRWELREAVRQAQAWESLHRAGCYLSINLSPFDLLYPHLVSELSTLVSDAGLSPASFRLEITESMLINNVSQSRSILNELREAGFGVMMDDFGTGFSSLSYLRQLPFTAVKIDRSFTQAITWDIRDLGLVRNIINLVHFLEMETIIEGVETGEQHELLKSLQPVYCQGYLFAKPMTAIDAEDYLRSNLGGGQAIAAEG